jgi:hypothetical protein
MCIQGRHAHVWSSQWARSDTCEQPDLRTWATGRALCTSDRLLKYTWPTCGACTKSGQDGRVRPVALRVPCLRTKSRRTALWIWGRCCRDYMTRRAWCEGVSRHKTASTAAGYIKRANHGAWTSSSPTLLDDALSQWSVSRCRLGLDPCIDQCTPGMRRQTDTSAADGE